MATQSEVLLSGSQLPLRFREMAELVDDIVVSSRTNECREREKPGLNLRARFNKRLFQETISRDGRFQSLHVKWFNWMCSSTSSDKLRTW